MRVLIVFGTRPEAIKMVPLVKEFKKRGDIFNVKVCVTGQHRQMLDQVLDLFEVQPDYDMNIMKHGQDLFDVTASVLLGMKNILEDANPDLILVHGDTATSTFAALAAFYKQIPVGHVEAGLRTHNIYSPWPEEINRRLTGRIATIHFAPTTTAKKNLLNENVKENNIIVTGNTVIDALYIVLDKIKSNTQLNIDIENRLIACGLLKNNIEAWITGERKLILITGHRRENFGEGFLSICRAIRTIATQNPEVDLVYPVHLNPNVRKPVSEILGNEAFENIFLIEPLDYLPFVQLMEKSYLILTDSGGIQEEAPGLEKPVLVMRDTTERPEVVEAGSVKLVGTNELKIVETVNQLLNNETVYNSMSKAVKVYGDGNSSKCIVDFLLNNSNAIKERHLL